MINLSPDDGDGDRRTGCVLVPLLLVGALAIVLLVLGLVVLDGGTTR